MQANPDFKTETAWTYEIGATKKILSDSTLTLSLFYSDISDYQQHNYISAAPSAIVYNIDMTVWGVETQLSRSFSRKTSGYIGYSYTDWDAESHPMDTENTHYFMQALPKHKAFLGLNHKLWEGGLVSLHAKYYSSRLSKREDRMEPVLIVDVGAEHTFQLPQDCSFTVRGYVNNVTDQDYQLHYGYDMPGTTAGMSATLNF